MINDNTSLLDSIGLSSTQAAQQSTKSNSEMGQEEFLQLMVAQLQNQDPFKPMESGDFLSDIAQFNQVEGLSKLQESFESLSESMYSNQAMQAGSLVGREVMAPTGTGVLPAGGSIKGAVELPASSPWVSVNVYDSAGTLVRKLNLGAQQGGEVGFKWDGIMENGEQAPPGAYLVSAEAQFNGRNEAMETLVSARVESVTLNRSGGLLLNLEGLGSLDFSQVKQIS